MRIEYCYTNKEVDDEEIERIPFVINMRSASNLSKIYKYEADVPRNWYKI
jgi:hypothetical protein